MDRYRVIAKFAKQNNWTQGYYAANLNSVLLVT